MSVLGVVGGLSTCRSFQAGGDREAERARLKAGIEQDAAEENKWRKEYQEMGVQGMEPTLKGGGSH